LANTKNAVDTPMAVANARIAIEKGFI
jgi:hypothetical protein